MFLIDTNVVSEIRKGDRCNVQVSKWYSGVRDYDLFTSVLVVGEIRKGAEGVRSRQPAKAAAIDAWLRHVRMLFGDRILSIDLPVAEQWALYRVGPSRPLVDTLLAATARVHGLIFVTRNVRDVEGLDVLCLNPFD
ncbi:MAG: PIN domain-containing protein [Alphaproteobacteria bacterium]|jgi:predicted nucleic acid-binding protein|nr:PIN domain-containing protein [Alphaproteobacteria bacterium]